MEVNSIKIRTIETDGKGYLSFFEAKRDIPFDCKRIYYIHGVERGVKRGGHAHKKLKQLMYCPFGKIKIHLDDGINQTEVLLDEPSKGIVVSGPIWREMLWLESNSVLIVAASEYYDESDYIRDYPTFLSYVNNGE